jgi:ComF family protein
VLNTLVSRIWNEALNTLYPLHCLGCNVSGANLCDACTIELPRLSTPHCARCAQPDVGGECHWCHTRNPKFDRIIAPFIYDETSPIYDAIIGLKFGNLRALAPELGDLLAQHLAKHPVDVDLIVPVPSHPTRLRSRGFNQAELLASELSTISELPIDSHLLIRAVNSPSQLRTTSRDQRWDNVQGDFQTRASANDLRILLVDDLVTTGATMSACATALKEAGASSVIGLAVARTP